MDGHTLQRLEFEKILGEEEIILSRPEKQRLYDQITADIMGFGPIHFS